MNIGPKGGAKFLCLPILWMSFHQIYILTNRYKSVGGHLVHHWTLGLGSPHCREETVPGNNVNRGMEAERMGL